MNPTDPSMNHPEQPAAEKVLTSTYHSFGLVLPVLCETGRVRPENEDHFAYLPDLRAVMIADGMGGHRAGGEASAAACNRMSTVIKSYFKNYSGSHPFSAIPREGPLRDFFRQVNTRLHRDSSRPSRKGWGTTLDVLLLDGDVGMIGHVGDGRVYYLYEDGRLACMTRDDTYAQAKVDNGDQSPAQALVDPDRSTLLRYMGKSDIVNPAVIKTDLTQVRKILLTTDGVHSLVTDDELRELLCNLSGRGVLDGIDDRVKNPAGILDAYSRHADWIPPDRLREELPACDNYTAVLLERLPTKVKETDTNNIIEQPRRDYHE